MADIENEPRDNQGRWTAEGGGDSVPKPKNAPTSKFSDTLEAARSRATTDTQSILKIEDSEGKEKYICCRANRKVFDQALKAHPDKLPGVKRTLEEYPVTPKERIEIAHKSLQEKEAALEKNVPGIGKLRQAHAEASMAKAKYEKAFSREMTAPHPGKAQEKVAQVASENPRAAAYIHAEGYADASHVDKVTAGKKAMQRLERGEEHNKVIADMEKEWSEAAAKSVYNN